MVVKANAIHGAPTGETRREPEKGGVVVRQFSGVSVSDSLIKS